MGVQAQEQRREVYRLCGSQEPSALGAATAVRVRSFFVDSEGLTGFNGVDAVSLSLERASLVFSEGCEAASDDDRFER